jgi:hypothetical protein
MAKMKHHHQVLEENFNAAVAFEDAPAMDLFFKVG